MKPADWKNQGWRSELFEKRFLLAILLVFVLFALIEIPGVVEALRRADSITLATSARLWLFTKALFACLSASLFLALPARLAGILLFQPFERIVQAVATLIFFVTTLLVNLLTALSANAPLAAEYSNLYWLVGNGPRGFRTFHILLWGFAVVMAVARMIATSASKSERASRMITIAVLLGGVLAVDWVISVENRDIAPENIEPPRQHGLTIIIPELSADELDTVLAEPRLSDWKSDLRLRGEVVGASTSLVAQAITLLTGLQPWEHGVRTDSLDDAEKRALAEFVGGRVNQKNFHTEIRSVGSTTPLADILDNSKKRLCTEDSETKVRIAVAQSIFMVYSQIPDQVFSWIFPESKCTQSLAPMPTLASQELADFNRAFQKPTKVHSIWWLDPRPLSHRPKGEAQAARLLTIGDTLSVFASNLELTQLRSTTRITLIGLSEKTEGSFALIANSSLNVPKTPSKSKLIVGSAQLTPVLEGQPFAQSVHLYREELQEPAHGTLGASLSRAVFYARRSLRCAWGTDEFTTTEVELRPNNAAVTVEKRNHKGTTVPWPSFSTEEECQDYFQKEFLTILKSDVSLLNRRPLVALFQRSGLPFGSTP